MNRHEDANLLGFNQVADILDAYAEARLAPRKPILARIRAAVVAEAANASAVRAEKERGVAAAAARVLDSPARRGPFGLPRLTLAHLRGPAFAMGFAGLLALSTGAAITSASPGSALYMARVALEDMLLPVQIDARFAAHEQHLGERLAEAEAAAQGGDAVALEAALAAYQDEIDQTLADIGNDFGRLDHFQAVLEAHVAKLTALSLRLPTEVARGNAEDHAIQASQSAVTKAADAVTRVKEQKAHSNNQPPSPPGQENRPSRLTVPPPEAPDTERRTGP